MLDPNNIQFPTDLDSIEARIRAINPVKYASSRNFVDGAVTYLSPYISRGVISTKQIFEFVQTLDLRWEQTEKLVQELAWRDYWQQAWVAKKDAIKQDLKYPQAPVAHHEIPKAILQANTGIIVVDDAIKQLYATGYMHNHMRMYVASICCNIAQSHWLVPAKWMYSRLLDGDLASNYLSWQWVAGANSSKKYYANQGNINKYFKGNQVNTFLDIEYDKFEYLEIPNVLKETEPLDLVSTLPDYDKPVLDKLKTTLIYNYYNLSPYWHKEADVQRVLLLEPSFFEETPVSKRCMDFALELAKNISGLKIFVGSFSDLAEMVPVKQLVYREHPTNEHYEGKIEPREWMSSVKGYYPSFFAFWKKAQKEIKS
jgi:deoxyribodipyrimidine photo-lyase